MCGISGIISFERDIPSYFEEKYTNGNELVIKIINTSKVEDYFIKHILKENIL